MPVLKSIDQSSSNGRHGPVLALGDLKHAGMAGFLLLDGTVNDVIQVLGGQPSPHSISQGDLCAAEQANLHRGVRDSPLSIPPELTLRLPSAVILTRLHVEQK